MIHSSKKCRWFLLLWISLLLGIPAFADDAKPGEGATPPAPSAADKDAAKAPPLPAYFSGANADEKKPTWPDPTGGAAGNWATPAGDGTADVPSKMSNPDLYDRIAHN